MKSDSLWINLQYSDSNDELLDVHDFDTSDDGFKNLNKRESGGTLMVQNVKPVKSIVKKNVKKAKKNQGKSFYRLTQLKNRARVFLQKCHKRICAYEKTQGSLG